MVMTIMVILEVIVVTMLDTMGEMVVTIGDMVGDIREDMVEGIKEDI